ncbi:hypothetical protein ARTHRO8AJ_40179 [Arthrobacter sp. 8AJ]|nr:hypothetical protein ARTHRO8AJ_40179 [Arthrobacter sp. 8AJ]
MSQLAFSFENAYKFLVSLMDGGELTRADPPQPKFRFVIGE